MLGGKRLNWTYDSHMKFFGGEGVELTKTSGPLNQRK